MKYRFGLRLKLVLIFMVFVVIISSSIIEYNKLSFKESITKKYNDNASSIAKLAASILDGDLIVNYAKTLTKDKAYDEMQKNIDNIKAQTDVYYLYVIYPFDKEKGIYIFDGSLTGEQVEEIGSEASTLGDEIEFGDAFPSAMDVLESGKPSEHFDITQTLQGNAYQWLASAYAPIFDSQGKVVAFAGADVNITDIEEYINTASYKMTVVVVGIILICMLVLIFIMQGSVIRPIKILTKHAEEITEGNFDNRIKIKGHDEISEISTVFNRMSGSIKGHMNEIQIINDAYYKYVPSRIFELLKKESVIDVKPGDQVNVDLAVMYFNVVGLSEIIRTMTSADMFSFINNVLNNVLPFVIEKDGVVETFQDAGFSAFFSNKCEASLTSAISMCQKINLLNKKKQLGLDENINIGIGITYGPVMMGIVGHDMRQSTISISEQTKMAEYLQKIAHRLNSRIIVTAPAAGKIQGFDKAYHSRFLGFFYYSATNHYVKIYDVFDGDDEESFRLKLNTKTMFEEGVNYFCARQFDKARLAFVNVLKINRRDGASREYLYLCNKYYQMEEAEKADIYIDRL